MHELFNSNNFPKHLLDRATLRGNEFAWPLEDIPSVIEAVQAAGYISIGGQLQFRFEDHGTCEIYEVEVNTSYILEKTDQSEHVEASAAEAIRQFNDLPREFDFVAHGRTVFGKSFDEIGATESDIREAMCFVWYARNPDKDYSLPPPTPIEYLKFCGEVAIAAVRRRIKFK